jgi:putative oxidoreductase
MNDNVAGAALSLRIGLGLFFLIFGILKFAAQGPMMGNVYPAFWGGLAVPVVIYILGVLQIIGALLLLIGFWTRPAAIVLGLMHLGTVIVSIGRIVQPFTFPEGGPPNFLFFGAVPILGAIIALIMIGPGDISLEKQKEM